MFYTILRDFVSVFTAKFHCLRIYKYSIMNVFRLLVLLARYTNPLRRPNEGIYKKHNFHL